MRQQQAVHVLQSGVAELHARRQSRHSLRINGGGHDFSRPVNAVMCSCKMFHLSQAIDWVASSRHLHHFHPLLVVQPEWEVRCESKMGDALDPRSQPTVGRRTWSGCPALCCLAPARTRKPPDGQGRCGDNAKRLHVVTANHVRCSARLTRNAPRTTNSAATSGGSGGSNTCTIPAREKFLRGKCLLS